MNVLIFQNLITFECLDDVFNIKSIEINIVSKDIQVELLKVQLFLKTKPIIGFTTPIQINDFEFETTNELNN